MAGCGRGKRVVLGVLAVLSMAMLGPVGVSAEGRGGEVEEYAEELGVSTDVAAERLALQQRGMGIVGGLTKALGAQYAGVWFDNATGEFVVPLIDEDERQEVLVALRSEDLEGDFRTAPATFSWAELNAAQTRLDQSLAGPLEQGLVQTMVDPRTNSVIVRQATEMGARGQARIARIAGEERGVDVDVRERREHDLKVIPRGCFGAGMICGNPLRGGVRMYPSGPGSCCQPATCTPGFKAVGKSNGQRYMLGAGHCMETTEHWMSFDDVLFQSHYIGYVEQYNNTTGDYGKIRASGTWWDKPSWPSKVVYWGTSEHERSINSEAYSYLGQWVCHAGGNSGASCGTVTAQDMTVPQPTGPSYHQTEFQTVCIKGGDSGGPVFIGNTALGITIANNYEVEGQFPKYCEEKGYYTEVTEATDHLNVTVGTRLSSPPPPPVQPPIKASFVDTGNANTLTVWEYGPEKGWQQTFLWGHPVAAGTRPFLMKYEGTTHILFVDAARGNQITEWSWSPTLGWQQTFLNTDPVAPGSSLTGFVQSGYPQIFFSNAANNRSITALVRIGSAWYPANFYGDPVATNSSPTAILNNGQPQVYFADSAKGNTMAAWTWNSVSGWQQTFFYGDPVAANSSPSAISNNGQAQVYFVDSAKGNTIAAWTWGGSIQQSFFYGDSVAPNSSPSAISANGTPHIYFADGSKNNTVAVWVWTPASLKQTFFYGDSVAANSSPSAILTSGGKDQIFFSDENTNRSLALWEWGSTLQQSRLYGHLAVAGTSPGA